MTKRISLIGAAGCGKSTLAAQLFSEMKRKHINVELVDEWIRRDIQKNGTMESIWEQYRTRFHQKEIEDAIPQEVDYAVIDSGTLTPYFYSCLYANKEDPRERLVLQDMFRYFIDDLFMKRYDYVFYLPSKKTFSKDDDILKDGTRYQSPEEMEILSRHMDLMFRQLYKLDNVFVIDGPLEDRLQRALTILDFNS